VGSCKRGDEPTGSGAMELVSYFLTSPDIKQTS
jgi:hypothetical protein